MFDPKNPCHQPPVVPYPDLPKFEFSFNDEISLKHLQEKLSSNSYSRLMEIMGSVIVDETKKEFEKIVDSFDDGDDTGGYDTYDDVYTDIDTDISSNNDVVITNTPTSGNSSVSIGGVIVPVTTASNLSVFTFQICPVSEFFIFGGRRTHFVMNIEVPDATWVTNGGTHHYIEAGQTTTNGITETNRVGNTITLTLQSSHLISDNSQNITINGEISFTNGCVKSFTVDGANYFQCFTGKLTGDCNPTTGGGNTTTSPKDTPAFIPTGFGVKQLGIADYKKVEQSVQCYVEGEVAHIENIMARERRDRSTRRLVKTENTDIQSSDTETEKVTDTTTTDRFEMHTEVAKIMQESTDMQAETHFDADWGGHMKFGGSASFASHSSNEENTRQAITQAKEITNKATDRITTKVHQERIRKVTEEFEETNIHEFDNRKGDKHVVGVYRWVDKLYKNQIVNYGKRLMFEFMVPEPAKLHLLGMKENAETMGTKLVEPTDPRKSKNADLVLTDYLGVDETKAKYWAGVYNVDLKEKLDSQIEISFSFKDTGLGIDDNGHGRWTGAYNNDFKIPDNYQATYIHGNINVGVGDWNGGRTGYLQSYLYICGVGVGGGISMPLNKIRKNIALSGVFWDAKAISGTLVATCELIPEAQKQWQQTTFKAIIDAYNVAKEEYKQRLAEEQTKASNIKGTNPGFYRQIENMVLRKNCISYIIDQTTSAKNTYGKDMTKYNYVNGVKQDPTFGSYEIAVKKDLDDYAAFVKFIEQAFEWDIMSYNFYPYYWGARQDWAQLYQYDNNDPLFRSFMQSGMARVIVTVRPGFEEAVRFYMQTGQIWNGGAVPVIEDKLFMSIVDELRAPTGKKEGKAWITRVPTALTILQANSIGLEVEKALPCHCEDIAEFEDPSQIPCADNFVLNNALINGGTGTAKLFGKIEGNDNLQARITLKTLAGLVQEITLCNTDGEWELTHIPAGKYDLLIDSTNVFDTTTYEVIAGSKTQMVDLSETETLEVNLTVNKL